MVAGQANGADEAPVELTFAATAVEWSWIVPAGAGTGAGASASQDDDASEDASEDEDEDKVERLAEFRPRGEAPVRLGTIRFQYDGEAPAGALRIVGTVPADLEYVDGSATGPGAETAYDPATRRLTWTIAGPLDPGTRGLVSFRALPRNPRDAAADAGAEAEVKEAP